MRSRSVVGGASKCTDPGNNIKEESIVHRDLWQICSGIKEGDRNAMDRLKAYVKSFEVRKRLYTEYLDWKPAEGALFEEYDTYLIFSDCLLEAYRRTGGLKYYSCLLKVDDVLLSIQFLLTCRERERLLGIISEELEIFQTLSEKHGIVLEE